MRELLILFVLSTICHLMPMTTLSKEERIYCVNPNSDTFRCSGSQYLCEDLHFYTSNISLYFTNDTVFEFLPGEHKLLGDSSNSAIIAELKNLRLTGETVNCFPAALESRRSNPPPRIACTGEGDASGGFIFRNIENLTLSALSISGCGRVAPSYIYDTQYGAAKAALAFGNVRNLHLQSLTVTRSNGYGILTHNIRGKSLVKECNFCSNRGNAEFRGGNAHFNFSDCAPEWDGTELTLQNSRFSFGGYHSDYEDLNRTGTLATGISMLLACTDITVLLDNVTADHNFNDQMLGFGGNMFLHFYNFTDYISNAVRIRNSHFSSGNSMLGAGLGITLFIGTSVTTENLHRDCLNTVSVTNCSFNYNNARAGSGLYLENLQQNHCRADFNISDSTFSHNKISPKKNSRTINDVGVAIAILDGELNGVPWSRPRKTFSVALNNVTVEYNSMVILDYQRLASGSAALLVINFQDNFKIRDSQFEHNNVTGISAFHSYVTFSGSTVIRNNTGIRGGGLIVCESTQAILTPNTSVSFIENHAKLTGGGIHSEMECSNSAPLCFFQIDMQDSKCGHYGKTAELSKDCDIHFYMTNNTAGLAGSHIYGGSIGHCYINVFSNILEADAFFKLFEVEGSSTDLSKIASDPKMACFCQRNETNGRFEVDCFIERVFHPNVVYPGEKITLFMVTAGQMSGAVPGLLRVNSTSAGKSYTIHNTESSCKQITFATKSSHDYSNTTYEIEALLQSSASNSTYTIGQSKYLSVGFRKCPSGFVLNKSKCDCHGDWSHVSCNFEERLLKRWSPAWIGFSDKGMIYQSECPYDYCLGDYVEMKLDNGSFDPDKQCAMHRRERLCSKCERNYSLSVSSSACVNCSNHPTAYLAGYITVKLFFGAGLILLLSACDLTTTSGTLSGILFYASVFQMNGFLFAPNSFNAITVAMSWMNLDFQVMQCSYNGLDSYAKAWLQFVSPLYLWTLVAIIVWLSRQLDCVARLFAGNIVKVLATLIEFSYAGLVQAVVIALSPISVTVYSQGNRMRETLWRYDGTIRYLELRHLPLFITGSIFGVFILVHTLILLFVQPLQRYSNTRCFSWVAKLKPLIDAYTAPNVIRGHCQFFPGFLLLVRLLLVLTFAVNTKGVVHTNLMAIVTACLVVLMVSWSVGGIYERASLNVLNSLSIINLGMVSLLKLGGHVQVFVVYVSASLTILIFLCVVCFHALRRMVLLRRRWKRRKIIFLRAPFDVENSSLLPRLRES